VLFLGTTLSVWVGLAWLSWKALEQDRELEAQKISDQRDRAIGSIADELTRNLEDIEAQLDRHLSLSAADLSDELRSYGQLLPESALVVSFDRGAVQAFPRERLLFYPELPGTNVPYVDPLLPASAMSQVWTDPRGASEVFAALAESGDQRTRASALLTLALIQKNLGQHGAALGTYARLQQPDVLVDGRPAELMARLARCELLAELGRRADLTEDARRLSRDLHAGRWQLTRAAYAIYEEQARAFLPPDATMSDGGLEPAPTALAIAESVDQLWLEWANRRNTPTGRESHVHGGKPMLVLWRATDARLVALVAGPAFLEDRIVGPFRSALDQQGMQLVLEDGEGRALLSYGTVGPQAESSILTRAEAELPWNLRVVSDAETSQLQFARQRQLVIAGLGFLGLFVVAGSYLSVRAMTREIEAARLKSDFVAAVSHEFRTPLTLMRQFSDLLAEDRVSSDQERHRYYEALQRGTRRLTRLVEDLLDFGRMEAGSRAFGLEPVLARDCVESVAREFQDEVRNRGYALDVSWRAPEGLVIQADEAAVGRALWNLLDNAVKYSPSSRTVWLSADFERARLVIRVRDEGLGVSSREQRSIFKKFVRGSASRGHEIKGTGLGLALVQQIVEAHGGEIRVESVEGAGSTFSIVLPATVVADVKPRTPSRDQPRWRAS